MKGKVLSRERRTDSGSRAKRRKVFFLTRRKREIGGRVGLEGRRGAELRSSLEAAVSFSIGVRALALYPTGEHQEVIQAPSVV